MTTQTEALAGAGLVRPPATAFPDVDDLLCADDVFPDSLPDDSWESSSRDTVRAARWGDLLDDLLAGANPGNRLSSALGDTVATLLADRSPGSDTAQLIDLLDHEGLTGRSLTAAIIACDRLSSWASARQQEFTAALARPGVGVPADQALQAAMYGSASRGLSVSPTHPVQPRDDPATGLPDPASVTGDPDWQVAIAAQSARLLAPHLAVGLHLSPAAARERVESALDMADNYPAVLAAQRAGTIDRIRAAIIAERTRCLAPTTRARLIDHFLPRAGTMAPGRLRIALDRAVISADPEAAAARAENARVNRQVSIYALTDDMARLAADLPAEKAHLAYALIDAVAASLDGDLAGGRGIGELRADVLTDIFGQLAATGHADITTTGCASAAEDASGSPRGAGVGDTEGSAAHGETSAGHDANASNGSAANSTSTTDVAAPEELSTTPCDSTIDCDPTTICDSTADCADGAGLIDDEGAARSRGDAPDTARNEATTGTDRADDEVAADSRSDTPDTARNEATTGTDLCTVSRTVNSAVDRVHGAGNDIGTPHQPSASACDNHLSTCGEFGENDQFPPASRSAGSRGMRIARISRASVQLNVTVAASTLAGWDDEPGDLAGHGAITADLARALARSADTIRAVLTHRGDEPAPGHAGVSPSSGPGYGAGPSGEGSGSPPRSCGCGHPGCADHRYCGTTLDYGRAVYLPPAALVDHLIATQPRCRFPGCRMPARRCDIDHRVPFRPGEPDGGPTCPCNLQVLCRTHHINKTFTTWTITPHPDGTLTWTSPLGPSADDAIELPPLGAVARSGSPAPLHGPARSGSPASLGYHPDSANPGPKSADGKWGGPEPPITADPDDDPAPF